MLDSCAECSALLLLLPEAGEEGVCAVATSVKTTLKSAAFLSGFHSFNRDVRRDRHDDDGEKEGVIGKGTINSTLPWSLREQRGGCNLPRRPVRYPRTRTPEKVSTTLPRTGEPKTLAGWKTLMTS